MLFNIFSEYINLIVTFSVSTYFFDFICDLLFALKTGSLIFSTLIPKVSLRDVFWLGTIFTKNLLKVSYVKVILYYSFKYYRCLTLRGYSLFSRQKSFERVLVLSVNKRLHCFPNFYVICHTSYICMAKKFFLCLLY